MAEAGRLPTFDALMWPTLVALKETGGSATNQELLAKVTQLMGLPEDVQTVPHGEGPLTEVGYRLAWARTYLGKAAAIENSSRSVWSITAKGRELTEEQVAKIPSEIRAAYSRGAKPGTGRKGPDRAIDVGLEPEGGDDDWKGQLLSVLQGMGPDAFERLCQRVLRESGFIKVEVTGRRGDGGIDGIGVLRLNLLSFQVFFQCKRYKDTVGLGDIRDFRGAMVGRTDKGLFITTGRFTPDARREATRDGAPPLDLIDGEQLCDILKSLKLGVSTEMVERVTIQPGVFKRIWGIRPFSKACAPVLLRKPQPRIKPDGSRLVNAKLANRREVQGAVKFSVATKQRGSPGGAVRHFSGLGKFESGAVS